MATGFARAVTPDGQVAVSGKNGEKLQRVFCGDESTVKRNKMAAVVLSEEEYLRLTRGKTAKPGGMTAMQWLLAQPAVGRRSKAWIDASLKAERAW